MTGGVSVFNRNSFSTQSFSRKSWKFALLEAVGHYLRAVRLTVRTGIASVVTSSKALTATVRRKPYD
jgi:hypothetical protein